MKTKLTRRQQRMQEFLIALRALKRRMDTPEAPKEEKPTRTASWT